MEYEEEMDVYEFYRAVFGISDEETRKIIDIDWENSFRLLALYKLAKDFQIPVPESNRWHDNSTILTNHNILTILFEGKTMLIYFPEKISIIQYHELEKIVIARMNYKIAFNWQNNNYDAITVL